jgi:membrane protein YdbS with pleckstrin-like domain
VLWTGRPWILPSVVARSVLIVVIAALMSWLEFLVGLAYNQVLTLPAILWTNLVLFLIWVLSIVHLLALRASSAYTLRNDGVEIRVGILSSRSFVVAPSGFSDLEVIRSVSGRILSLGDIIIRTQGERDLKMERVKNPLKVADQIREVMSRPIVRIERQESTEEK